MLLLSPYLSCPVCQETLRLTDDRRSLTCQNNHRFDRAKQGYFNLLLNQHKKSKQPGDSLEMVQARTAFLNLGHYEPILSALKTRLATHLRSTSLGASRTLNYCDVACGEGYYTHAISHFLAEYIESIHTTGLDISTPALKAASRQYKQATWLVGNAFKLPLAQASQDLCTFMFCRLSIDEVARVLKPNGIFVFVETGNKHLEALRAELYNELKDKSAASETTITSAYFDLIDRQQVQGDFTLNNGVDIENLISMTPHVWRSKKQNKLALIERACLALSYDVTLHILMRNNTPYTVN